MKDLEKLKMLMRLKEVERTGEVNKRKESTADHVYGCIILAEHFLKKIKETLDEAKVLKLILYHDLVEIETGDFFILDEKHRENKETIEAEGAKKLAAALPDTISAEFLEFFNEYEDGKTREAKFAIAMDKLEPMVHWAVYMDDWTKWGFTEENLKAAKTKYLEPFPELLEFFNDMMQELKEKGNF
jgi:putative hydrolase of HD superfamily